ncbi:MAG: hypothetical protein EXR66_00715 [Dehalococcoidia bacterium]|nr:hypothetical protein [Dehalococcoidia bacterium]
MTTSSIPADSASAPRKEAAARLRSLAVGMAAEWLGQRFFRTFRPVEGDPAPFDARLRQRDRVVGVTFATLWDDAVPRAPAIDTMERLVSADLAARDDSGAYVVWAPPNAEFPPDEPQRSEFRLLLGHGLSGLAPGQRRELRIPVLLRLAKTEPEGAYMMVTGPLSVEWAHLSEGLKGVFHLDARDLLRLPDEAAELDIIMTRIRDRATVMESGEVTNVEVHDYWSVSRLSTDEPAGLTIVSAPRPGSMADADDGTRVRRGLRRAVRRATEQRAAAAADATVDYGVLVLLDVVGHLDSELVTQALRGMSPATYGSVDQILLVADGQVREILQPRQLPWGA